MEAAPETKSFPDAPARAAGFLQTAIQTIGQENVEMVSTVTAELSASSTSLRPFQRPQTRDYSLWTFEELQALAIQLRIRDAELKTRNELIQLLAGGV